jgi:Ca2+-transporting ATPase
MQRSFIEDGPESKVIGDPVDTALLRAAQVAGLNVPSIRAEQPMTNEIPFSSERKMMTTIHFDHGQRIAYTKGAPGVVLDHCLTAVRQTGNYRAISTANRSARL